MKYIVPYFLYCPFSTCLLTNETTRLHDRTQFTNEVDSSHMAPHLSESKELSASNASRRSGLRYSLPSSLA